MSIPLTHQQELLHVAYITALAARAGVTSYKADKDYGVDLMLQRVGYFPRRKKFITKGHPLQCQLKATTKSTMQDGYVVYDMDAEAYDKLVVLSEREAKGILILFCQPDNPEQWMFADEQWLWLKRCCYWKYIGEQFTENKEQVRIRIPTTNLLTPDSIQTLVAHVNEGTLGTLADE